MRAVVAGVAVTIMAVVGIPQVTAAISPAAQEDRIVAVIIEARMVATVATNRILILEDHMARKVYHSVPTKTGWKVEQSGKTISNHRTQKASEDAATAAGRRAKVQGGLGQAVLHKTDGKIREERTYGDDPRKIPG